MKNSKFIYLVLILVLAISITACRKDNPIVESDPVIPPVEQPADEVEEDEKAIIMNEFMVLVEEQEASAKDLKVFIDEKLPLLGQLEGNMMIDSLEKALIRDLQNVNAKIWDLNSNRELQEIVKDESAVGSLIFSKEKIEEIEKEELKAVVKEAYENHYKLIQFEGEFEAIIDYQSLRVYDPKITDEWKEYLAIMSIDSEAPPFIDGAFNLSFDGLADRIIRIENYLNRYLGGDRQEELIGTYEQKLTAYLKGLPNTPIAAYDTKIIFDNVFTSYEKTAATEGYVTSAMIYLYLEDIKGNDKIIDDYILTKADGYINEAVRTLREFK